MSELIVARQIDVGGAPARILVSPWGRVETTKGAYILDEQAAHDVIAAFQAQGVTLVIDREHHTMGGQYASPDGLALAAGWIKSLEAVPPRYGGDPRAGLFACVEWTDRARQWLINKEYRYLSPVMARCETDDRAMRLHSAGLTNRPATVGARPLVASDTRGPNSAAAAIIAQALTEWNSEPGLAAFCDRQAYMKQALRDAEV